MKILVIDGQGGGIGRQIVEKIKRQYSDVNITAVGTNAVATQAMLKAGADTGATGENAVLVNCRNADLIVGPVGIAIADSMCGEISPKMSVAVGQSNAVRILIPMNQCDNYVAGYKQQNFSEVLNDCIEKIGSFIK